MAPSGETEPPDGVIATRPDTRPEAAPSEVGEVVGPHRFAAEPEPTTQDQGEREGGGTGVDLDRGATREVDQPDFSSGERTGGWLANEIQSPTGSSASGPCRV